MWGTHKARSTTQSSAPWTIFYRAGWLRTTSPRPSQVHPGQEATFESESFAFHPSLSWTFQLVHFQISPSPRKALSFPGDVSESREVQSPGDPLASESASHSANLSHKHFWPLPTMWHFPWEFTQACLLPSSSLITWGAWLISLLACRLTSHSTGRIALVCVWEREEDSGASLLPYWAQREARGLWDPGTAVKIAFVTLDGETDHIPLSPMCSTLNQYYSKGESVSPHRELRNSLLNSQDRHVSPSKCLQGIHSASHPENYLQALSLNLLKSLTSQSPVLTPDS